MALLLLRLGALLAGLVACLASDADPVVWASGDRVHLDCVLPPGNPLQTRKPPPPLEADTDVQTEIPYNWTMNGEEINPKRISANGSVEVRRRDGSGKVYQCSVNKHGGVVLGYPQTVKFPFIDKKFRSHPANTAVMVGQPVMLACSIPSEPAASYAWTRNGILLSTDTRIYFINNQLLITEAIEQDVGQYTCIATNPKLNKVRTSNPAQLTVNPQLAPLEAGFLVEDETDERVAVEINGTALLACPVVGYPRPEIMWEFIPRDISMELDVVAQVLERPQFSADQEGLYVCSIIDHDLKKVFRVSMTDSVNITHPPQSKEPRRASTVRLNCNATGKPEPHVTWYKDGQPVLYNSRVRPMVANYENNLRQLVISSVAADDAGIYQCFATTPNSQASQWAVLTVPGDVGPKPRALTCRPVDAKTAKLTWTLDNKEVVAYTIHSTLSDRSLSSRPVKDPEVTLTLAQALLPEQFQVRAYVTGAASDMSDPVTCQGQGVPIQVYRDKSGVVVAWTDFARAEPGVRRWRVQLRAASDHHQIASIDLDAHITTHHINLDKGENVEVRVLGSKSDWTAPLDLSLVGWVSTAHASGRRYGSEEIPPAPEHLEIKKLTSHSVSLRWSHLDGPYSYTVCVSRSEQMRDDTKDCQDTPNPWILVSNLTPNTVYTSSVLARGTKPGPPSKLLGFITNPEEPSRFTNLTATHVNSTTIKVVWSVNPPAERSVTTKENYTIHYSPKLKLPVEEWNTLTVHDNFVYLTEVDPKDMTYVMVTAHHPTEHSTIITVAQHDRHAAEVKKNQISWEYAPSGLLLQWSGGSSRPSCEVRWAQNITQPVETWPTMPFTDLQVTLSVPEPALTTFVSVRCGGATDMLTVPGIPKLYNLKQQSSLYLGIGVGCAVCLIVVLTVTAIICIRSRHKPTRSRRRRRSDSAEEEGAELKSVGVRLANGAGQPLLNGHVHITENPALYKTPNGKVIKAKYEAFDLSRATDLDETAQTTLDANSADSSLLDPNTSSRRLLEADNCPRRPFDATKLPDDNMNSEVSSSQPTLQPNG